MTFFFNQKGSIEPSMTPRMPEDGFQKEFCMIEHVVGFVLCMKENEVEDGQNRILAASDYQ